MLVQRPETGKRYPVARDPDNPKRSLGYSSCPRQAEKNHGGWYARFDAPARPGNPRRQVRLGPFSTKKAADEAVVDALGKRNTGQHVDDRDTALGDHLGRWLERKRRGPKPAPFRRHRRAAGLYFRPGDGHIPQVGLRGQPLGGLHGAVREDSRRGGAGRRGMLARPL